MSNYFQHFFPAILLTLLLNIGDAQGQNEIMDNVRSALKTGSSRELATMFNSDFELLISAKKYDKKNGEEAIKSFFQTYPPDNFEYLHKGASKSGSLSYSIGHYESKGKKYRVVLRFKDSGKGYEIHKLELSEM
jgi:hypothetical protein